MSSVLKNRKSVVALYDVRKSNPNGDPNDDNRPRIDLATGENIISPYRIKRTIRDYIDKKGYEILIKEVPVEDGKKGKKDGKSRSKDFGKEKQEVTQNVLDKCIDVRLFGTFLPLDSSGSIDFTGPVQVGWSSSLHPVQVTSHAGTTTLASQEGNQAGTFSENHIVEYSLIRTLFTINEHNAQHTKLTNEDVDLMLEAFWNGTMELNTSSKFNQVPRFLLEIEYSTPNFQIPDLDLGIKMLSENGLPLIYVRSVEDYTLDISRLLGKLKKHAHHIKHVRYEIDTDIVYSHDLVKEMQSYGIKTSCLGLVPQFELVGV